MALNKSSNDKSIEWQDFQTLKERNYYLFNNQLMADVVFHFGENEELFGHKVIISSGSQVFYHLFYKSIDGSIDLKDNKQLIQINDCELNAFKSIVKYLYVDDIDINDSNVLNIIYCAKKYEIKSLINSCLEFITSKLNDNNCLKWWQQLARSQASVPEMKLIERCAQMIASNALNVLKSHEIIHLNSDQLNALYSRNDLNISEFELFVSAIRWSYQECIRRGMACNDHNLRQCLGSTFYLIRFPIMSYEDFGKIVAKYSDIFSQKELVSLISYINSNIIISDSMPFLMTPRMPVCGDSLVPNTYKCRCLSSELSSDSYIIEAQLPRCQTYSFMPFIPPCIRIQNTVVNSSPTIRPSFHRRLENNKPIVITDPKTGKTIPLAELATTEIRTPLDQLNCVKDSNTINSNNGDNDQKAAEVSPIASVGSNCIDLEDEELFIDASIAVEPEEDIKEEQLLVKSENTVEKNDNSSNNIPIETRLRYSRDFLISLRSSIISPIMRLRMVQIWDQFEDIFSV